MINTKEKEIRKAVRELARDKSAGWANALALLDAAYHEAQQDVPTPDEEDEWKRYEDLIEYTVQELHDVAGIDGDWRSIPHSTPDLLVQVYDDGELTEQYVLHETSILEARARAILMHDKDIDLVGDQPTGIRIFECGTLPTS